MFRGDRLRIENGPASETASEDDAHIDIFGRNWKGSEVQLAEQKILRIL